jgi:hypothetical protein
MAVIDPGIQQLLGQIFNEEIGSESKIREMMRGKILSLPDDLVHGRGKTREQLAESADPFEKIGYRNPNIIPFMRSLHDNDPAKLVRAFQKSLALVNENNFPGYDVLFEEETTGRVFQSVMICRFNFFSLLAMTQIMWMGGHVLASLRTGVDLLTVDPAHGQSRFILAKAASELGWHMETVLLADPNIMSLTVGYGEPIWSVELVPLYIDGLAGWLRDHYKKGGKGLVGGWISEGGDEMLLTPFERMESALVSFRSRYKRLADSPEQLAQDETNLKRMESMIESMKAEAAESGRLADPMPSGGAHWIPDPSKAVIPAVDDVARAISILLGGSVKCEGSGNRYSIVVNYRKGGREWDMNGEIAIVERNQTGWELMVMTAPYFWGEDWRDKPMTIKADNLSSVAQFIVNTLTPRMRNGTLSVPG